jgi:hypothetical protein
MKNLFLHSYFVLQTPQVCFRNREDGGRVCSTKYEGGGRRL